MKEENYNIHPTAFSSETHAFFFFISILKAQNVTPAIISGFESALHQIAAIGNFISFAVVSVSKEIPSDTD
mgnify:FL=1